MLTYQSIHTGHLKLDGGAMFGIVPKRLWQKLNPPDENNLCTWAMRAMLVQTDGRNILIDTGIGNKQDEKFRSFFEPHGPQSLFSSLADAGLQREDITDVFLTHLHFDHCGGALWKNETTGQTEVSFPNARYWTNERHWKWAMNPNAREQASFLQENFVPLVEQGKLHFVATKQNVSFATGFQVRFFNGHTEALMAPVLDTGDEQVVYCADALPSQWHVGMPYIMAYDVRPLVTLREKASLLEEAVKKRYRLFLEHDPLTESVLIHKDDRGRFIPISD
ncbi:MAG: MBL fold metallo-hydrolase [Saprospiraceae bacterium]|nr:MBL fold metallo-hydrolase [Saprospiraceae bacterium]